MKASLAMVTTFIILALIMEPFFGGLGIINYTLLATAGKDSSSLSLPQIFMLAENSIVGITTDRGQYTITGSGFTYDTQGHIVTSNDIVNGTEKAIVKFNDGNNYMAKELGADSETNLAVLQIIETQNNTLDGMQLKPLPLGNSSALTVGDQIIAAMGNPFGLAGTVTMTSGVVSQIGVDFPTESGSSIEVIQHDAVVNPGGGGPLLNTKGEVIGMNIAIYSNSGVYSGVTFAIPSNTVKQIVSELINGS